MKILKLCFSLCIITLIVLTQFYCTTSYKEAENNIINIDVSEEEFNLLIEIFNQSNKDYFVYLPNNLCKTCLYEFIAECKLINADSIFFIVTEVPLETSVYSITEESLPNVKIFKHVNLKFQGYQFSSPKIIQLSKNKVFYHNFRKGNYLK